MKKHEIKVQELHRPSARFNTVSERRAPKLTLQGKWLNAAGFPPGATAEIEVSAGKLIITARPPTFFAEEPRPRLRATKRAPWADVRDELSQFNH